MELEELELRVSSQSGLNSRTMMVQQNLRNPVHEVAIGPSVDASPRRRTDDSSSRQDSYNHGGYMPKPVTNIDFRSQ